MSGLEAVCRSEMRSSLQVELARDILDWLQDRGLPEGSHLPEVEVTRRFGVSRSPVRGALAILANQGVLEHQENRGYFLATNLADIKNPAGSLPLSSDDALYDTIARAWFRGEIPEQVAESELRRRFGQGRARITRVLRHLARDGIIRAATGHGWILEPSLSTEAAFEESYHFRLVIEPAAILAPSFELHGPDALKVRRRHDDILNRRRVDCRLQELVDADIEFHELIGRSSGNQFFAQAIQRQNMLRRLTEQQSTLASGRLHASCAEHLEILAALEADDRVSAAHKMRHHLTISSGHRPDYAR